MGAGLPQFDSLFVEFAGVTVGVRGDPLSQGLDTMLTVWIEEDDNGVPLGIVQGVHRLGCHIQQGMLVLCGVKNTDTR